MRKPVDVLWLVEHVAREMDVACAAAALLRRRGLTVAVRNMYLHAADVLSEFEPRVVVHPFFYFSAGALATEDFVDAWPAAEHFNLAWEQIHYSAHLKIKAPSDDFARRRVRHHAWGAFYKEYLERHGVPAASIAVNGHPSYRLYRPPYSGFFPDREALAAEHGLDPAKRWVLIADNYRWAFIGTKIRMFSRLGGDEAEMGRMRDFSVESLGILLRWCNRAAEDASLEVVFRPRPAIHTGQIAAFMEEKVGRPHPRLRILKSGSVREWALASDVVMSSYSTSLIEASIAGKAIRMIEPVPFPDSLLCDWYGLVPRVRTEAEFLSAARSAAEGSGGNELRAWAEREMLATEDPIEGLAAEVARLAGLPRRAASFSARRWLRAVKRRFSAPRVYFNARTHENDVFSREDAEARIADWSRHLSASGTPEEVPCPARP